MSESSMVCNGHKEASLEKCSINAVNNLFNLEKANSESRNIAENSSKDSMTIGTIPFPDFDHLYASSVDETGEHSSMSMNVARSNLNSYHLNIIEEQAKIIDVQNYEIAKLKKQNESLIARIERMNRRINLKQCNRRGNSRRGKFFSKPTTDGVTIESKARVLIDDNKSSPEDQLSDDIPLISLAPSEQNETRNNSICIDSNVDNSDKLNDNTRQKDNKIDLDSLIANSRNEKSNFRIKFCRNNIIFNNQRQKREKVVRFVEGKKTNSQTNTVEKPKRNCAKTVDEKLITDDAVLFLKTQPETPNETPASANDESNAEKEDNREEAAAKKKKILKMSILTTAEAYYTAPTANSCHLYDPVTYTPSALEVPSFRTVDKDYMEASDVPSDYFEDVTIEAAKERHQRFEVGERKRKKWDVQRIRELRQNERLKEKLRRRKSRWNKLESPKQFKTDTPEQITSLFPDIRCIEKIIITDIVPVTALGTCITRVPSWGQAFKTEWTNDGTVDPKIFEDNQPTHFPNHQRDSKTKPT